MALSDKKYCILPGREPVRLASLSGHTAIIGEEPRRILAEFELEAKGKGCFTEEEREALAARLAPSQAAPSPPLSADDKDAERREKITAAVIEMLNNGDPKLFDKKGLPELKPLAEKLGFEVTPEERDAAFAAAKG